MRAQEEAGALERDDLKERLEAMWKDFSGEMEKARQAQYEVQELKQLVAALEAEKAGLEAELLRLQQASASLDRQMEA
jgi:uncharacterized small protein (DUF1192 family)